MVQAEVHMHSRTSIGVHLLFELEEEGTVLMHRDTIGLEVHLTSEALPPQRNYLGFTSTVV